MTKATRTIGWFSQGSASAVAVKLAAPDVIVYCDTGSEDIDNHRFLNDCEIWFDKKIEVIKSKKYSDTWDVWNKRKYINGIAGAPCTSALKIKPRLDFQQPNDIHIFGYTADPRDAKRAEALSEHYPDLGLEYPLIDRGLTKRHCLAMLVGAGIKPPRVYAMGFPNANCIPCCKASSPAYWALVRSKFPDEFNRFADLEEKLGVKSAVIKGERIHVREIPSDQSVTKPLAPECDLLCHLAEGDLGFNEIDETH